MQGDDERPVMTGEECSCDKEGGYMACPACGKGQEPGYWCANCERAVPEKRCPLCGLKARKMRGVARPSAPDLP